MTAALIVLYLVLGLFAVCVLAGVFIGLAWLVTLATDPTRARARTRRDDALDLAYLSFVAIVSLSAIVVLGMGVSQLLGWN